MNPTCYCCKRFIPVRGPWVRWRDRYYCDRDPCIAHVIALISDYSGPPLCTTVTHATAHPQAAASAKPAPTAD
jgi:hypothetical protein